jgi:predicted nucleic acid-binding protein
MKRTEAPKPAPVAAAQDELVDLATWVRGYTTAQSRGLFITERRANFAEAPPSLYLETTIVSYLTARTNRDALIARRQTITRRWWYAYRARHVSFVSDVVREESQRGDPHASARRLEVLSTFAEVHSTAHSYELANRVLAACKLPTDVYDDAHHVAIAALNGIEALLTWNCAHLANPHIIPFIRRACEAYGYAAPVIHTPEQLIGACAYERASS